MNSSDKYNILLKSLEHEYLSCVQNLAHLTKKSLEPFNLNKICENEGDTSINEREQLNKESNNITKFKSTTNNDINQLTGQPVKKLYAPSIPSDYNDESCQENIVTINSTTLPNEETNANKICEVNTQKLKSDCCNLHTMEIKRCRSANSTDFLERNDTVDLFYDEDFIQEVEVTTEEIYVSTNEENNINIGEIDHINKVEVQNNQKQKLNQDVENNNTKKKRKIDIPPEMLVTKKEKGSVWIYQNYTNVVEDSVETNRDSMTMKTQKNGEHLCATFNQNLVDHEEIFLKTSNVGLTVEPIMNKEKLRVDKHDKIKLGGNFLKNLENNEGYFTNNLKYSVTEQSKENFVEEIIANLTPPSTENNPSILTKNENINHLKQKITDNIETNSQINNFSNQLTMIESCADFYELDTKKTDCNTFNFGNTEELNKVNVKSEKLTNFNEESNSFLIENEMLLKVSPHVKSPLNMINTRNSHKYGVISKSSDVTNQNKTISPMEKIPNEEDVHKCIIGFKFIQRGYNKQNCRCSASESSDEVQIVSYSQLQKDLFGIKNPMQLPTKQIKSRNSLSQLSNDWNSNSKNSCGERSAESIPTKQDHLNSNNDIKPNEKKLKIRTVAQRKYFENSLQSITPLTDNHGIIKKDADDDVFLGFDKATNVNENEKKEAIKSVTARYANTSNSSKYTKYLKTSKDWDPINRKKYQEKADRELARQIHQQLNNHRRKT